MTNRHNRRKAARESGGDWRAQAEAVKLARRLEYKALKMKQAQARKTLAIWAASGGTVKADTTKH